MTAAPLFFSQRMATLAQTHANHPALIDRDSPLTFAVLHQQTGQLAGNLAAIGLKPHERVAVWLPNCAAWVQTFLACAHLGATVLAVNTRFRSQEVADIIGRGKADWLVLWPAFKGIARRHLTRRAGQTTWHYRCRQRKRPVNDCHHRPRSQVACVHYAVTKTLPNTACLWSRPSTLLYHLWHDRSTQVCVA